MAAQSTYTFTLRVTDSTGVTGTTIQTVSVEGVTAGTLSLFGSLPPTVCDGRTYFTTIAIIGGVAPYSSPMVTAGHAPDWMLMSVIDGAIYVSGEVDICPFGDVPHNYEFDLTLSDSDGSVATLPLAITVAPQPIASSSILIVTPATQTLGDAALGTLTTGVSADYRDGPDDTDETV